jgi:Tol biopolymer transport system component
VTERNGTADRAQEAASGLYCSVGRDVFQRMGGRGVWQSVLPEECSGFGLEPQERPQPSPDGQHGAFVAVGGVERYVCVVSLPGPIVRTLTRPLTSVEGMAWSPDGKRVCVIGGDPSVGVFSIDASSAYTPLSLFSLFVAGQDDADLTPVAGPIVLPGIPRWSPAGDAVAVVGVERGGSASRAHRDIERTRRAAGVRRARPAG